jgi:putative pyruvate formate lyase activating enzyme
MVYLGGCNFRCSFCTQAPRCFRPDEGPELTAPETVRAIEAAAAEVRWINFVGGEPSLHPHALLSLRPLVHAATPWLLNTNGYFTPGCLDLIDSLFDLHLVDFKFGTDACATELAGVPGYVEVLRRNLLVIFEGGPGRLLVRHLLMPGHEACCLRPVAEWVAARLPGVRFNLMSSYVPNDRALRHPVVGRTVTMDEVQRAEAFCRQVGVNLVDRLYESPRHSQYRTGGGYYQRGA